jgi:hypothetical protein
MHNALMQADPQYPQQLERVLGQTQAPARGPAAWAQKGLQAMGVSDQATQARLLQDPKARALLQQASSLTPGSKAFKSIQQQLRKGWGTP